MRLTSDKALELLEEAKGLAENDNWIKHCLCVGDTAAVIAGELGMDVDKVRAMGYVHDIGKRYGYSAKIHHSVTGYEYLKRQDIDEEYASVCLTHSFLDNTVVCEGVGVLNENMEKFDFLCDYVISHDYDDYDRLINLCDLMCTSKMVGIEKRIVNLLLRYGVFPNTVNNLRATLKLKNYFDDKLGYNLYKLFPEDVLYNDFKESSTFRSS